eukprot:CAMPEP_0194143130 /NCGR_PEP_ID=MMETSP0152-20130528/12324_1 /TAXON_ID=1049557 /ORGANISM="Thalassiothrix antarctica, Strain L6-D1" /LENGTH=402 /DNA_ID=CAMNT_0038842395 /DNA_START=8 /DNA_END=1216 /DNA_ORIENTATION=-
MEEEFCLKDSPQEVIDVGEKSGIRPKGRSYNQEYSIKPCGIKASEVAFGIKCACVSIIDDNPGTLKEIAVGAGPWHIESMKMICNGDEEKSNGVLSDILDEFFGLKLDKFMNYSYMASNGASIDTQGYIAHNDTTVVLAYRCTTSIKDWMTNFEIVTSAWEPEEDIKQGNSGFLSCIEGRFDPLIFCSKNIAKPRLHSGFYDNFIASFPDIKEYVSPLLGSDEPPRTLYVVGHSLGAGVATVAATYMLFNFDWENSKHRFINVTAGSPRVVTPELNQWIKEKMEVLRPLDKAVIARVVSNKDIVARVPPAALGFQHIDKCVFFNEDNECLINPDLNNLVDVPIEDATKHFEKEDKKDDDDVVELTDYQKEMKMMPEAGRDHCPDVYLQHVFDLLKIDLEQKD